MKIKTKVYGLEEAIRQSGLPMTTTPDALKCDIRRGKNLARAKVGSGHDCFLKGILVTMEVTSNLKWFDQLDRYSFQDTISSTSQMHRIKSVDLSEAFEDETDPRTIEIVQELQELYNENPNEEMFRKLIMSIPQGFKYTRAITTNYLQLKTIYYQRRNHKLREWREFCKEIERLPMFKELVIKEDKASV